MKRFKNILKKNDLSKLIKHNINLCLVGTNGNYWKLLGFIVISLSTAIFESVPILIIVPFVSLITNPERAWKIDLIRNYANLFSINDPEKLLLPLTVVFVLLIIFSSAIRIFNITYITKFNAYLGENISKSFYQKTIYAPFEFFITNNSSEVLNSFISKVEQCVFSIQAFLNCINSFFISIFILSSILLVNLKISISIIFVMGTFYILIAYFKNFKLKKISRMLSITYSKRVQIIQESINSIRELILNGNQKNFIKKFNLYNHKREQVLVDEYLTTIYPKYLVEGVGLTLIGIFAFSLRSYESIDPLPILGALTLGLQKLLPQLQIVYASFTNISSKYEMSASLLSIISNLEEKNNFPDFNSGKITKLESLQLIDIAYKYPNTNKYSLKNINLTINKGDKIGIIGETGSGKSTLIELITTLLEPNKGKILFNGSEINFEKNCNNLFSWRRNISYVPQFVGLNDSTVLENIALGIPANKIDIEKAKSCAKAALIYDHIMSLEEGIFTNIGERGIKLSGGQIQRVAIARALYCESEVLVLDEATSALDLDTEERLVKSIARKYEKITILAIAHRLLTLKNYERLLKVENNTIIEINNLKN